LYEGEIKAQGDSVIIRSLASITVDDYVVGQAITSQRPTSIAQTLLIDKGKVWSVELDDVMKIQQDIKQLGKWTEDAAYQMKIAIETPFLASVYADSHASNKGLTAGRVSAGYNMGVTGTPLQITKVNVLDFIVDAGSVLDEQIVPETGRWMIIPSWMSGMIKKSDLKDVSMTGDPTTPMRNGIIGRIDRFTLYSSNLLYHAVSGLNDEFFIMFGHKDGITFATQLTKTENLRSVTTFADIVRGLQIYGYKTLKPEAIGTAVIYK